MEIFRPHRPGQRCVAGTY